MNDPFLTLIFILFGVVLAARLVKSMAKSQMKDGKPVNPNMSQPCPPHDWNPPKPEQKGQGIVYQCSKCKQIYPRTADPRQR